MTVQNGKRVALGDPVPWFRAANVDGGKTDICVSAGRWIVLAFLGSLGEAQAQTRLATLVKQAALFSDDHLIIYAVLSAPPDDAARLLAMSSPVLKFIADYDGAIGAFYGADEKPLTIALDPMLRAIANISCDHPDGHDTVLERLLRDLPSVDNSAGVPLTAPVLIVPRVFDFPLCDLLVSIYDKVGGHGFGFPRCTRRQTGNGHRSQQKTPAGHGHCPARIAPENSRAHREKAFAGHRALFPV